MLLRQLPRESRLARVFAIEAAWTPGEYLLAEISDYLAWGNYQRAEGKGKKPTPRARPGQAAAIDLNERRLGTPVPMAEARQILDDWSK